MTSIDEAAGAVGGNAEQARELAGDITASKQILDDLTTALAEIGLQKKSGKAGSMSAQAETLTAQALSLADALGALRTQIDSLRTLLATASASAGSQAPQSQGQDGQSARGSEKPNPSSPVESRPSPTSSSPPDTSQPNTTPQSTEEPSTPAHPTTGPGDQSAPATYSASAATDTTLTSEPTPAVGGSRTQPSLPPDPGRRPDRGPTPIPSRAKLSKQLDIQSENDAADVLARSGYQIEQNPPPKPNGKEPDYFMEGDYWDCFTPRTNNLDQVRKAIKSKVNPKDGRSQAERIVVNLDAGPESGRARFTPTDIEQLLQRRPLANLKELKVIMGGQVHDLRLGE